MTKKKSNKGEEGKQKKARSANYTSREDEFIAKAWGLATLKLKSKESLDEKNAESLQLRAMAQADSVTFNVMSKLGPNHPVAKEWFELKGQVALEKLRQESEQV